MRIAGNHSGINSMVLILYMYAQCSSLQVKLRNLHHVLHCCLEDNSSHVLPSENSPMKQEQSIGRSVSGDSVLVVCEMCLISFDISL